MTTNFETYRRTPNTKRSRLLVVTAHPDDEGLVVGFLDAHAQKGADMYAYVATTGKASTVDRVDPENHSFVQGGRRRVEASRALTARGIPTRRQFIADLEDGELHKPEVKAAAANHIGAMILRYSINTVVTLGESGLRHSDHASIHVAARSAILDSMGDEDISLYGLDLTAPTTRFAADPARKLKHLQHHRSQFGIDTSDSSYVPRIGTLEVPGIRLEDETNERLMQYWMLFQQEPYKLEIFEAVTASAISPYEHALAGV